MGRQPAVVVLTENQFRLAEALQVERLYDASAGLFVASRIGELAVVGDWRGVARWKATAAALNASSRGSLQ